MPNKHVPLRMCMACNEMKPKAGLLRIVRAKSDDGCCNVFVDKTFKAAGRGAYLCKNLDCLKRVRKSRRIDRIFSCKVPDEVYLQIEEEILVEQQ